MKRLLSALLLAIALPALAAVEVEGVKFEDTSKLGDSTLLLNGAGIRSRLFIKVYAIGLYLTERQPSDEGVLTLPGAKRIQIVTLRDLAAEKLADGLVEGLRRNHSESELATLFPRIEEMRASMLAIKEVPKGAAMRIDWSPATGTRLSFNGQAQGRDIPGEDFYRALLKIWLGGQPVAEDLKEALLGRGRQ